MELFGAKFCIALGAWKLRFVLMLEDEEPLEHTRPVQSTPHHVRAHAPGAHAR